MNEPKPKRKSRLFVSRLLLTPAIAAVMLLVLYVGCYSANLEDGSIRYTDESFDNYPRLSHAARRGPKFVVGQETSEIVFWPLFKVHQWADPERFEPEPKPWYHHRDTYRQ